MLLTKLAEADVNQITNLLPTTIYYYLICILHHSKFCSINILSPYYTHIQNRIIPCLLAPSTETVSREQWDDGFILTWETINSTVSIFYLVVLLDRAIAIGASITSIDIRYLLICFEHEWKTGGWKWIKFLFCFFFLIFFLTWYFSFVFFSAPERTNYHNYTRYNK